MEREPGDIPAFPVVASHNVHSIGLTKREWFTAMAMQGLLAGYWSNSDMSGLGPDEIASEAVQNADAAIARLSA